MAVEVASAIGLGSSSVAAEKFLDDVLLAIHVGRDQGRPREDWFIEPRPVAILSSQNGETITMRSPF